KPGLFASYHAAASASSSSASGRMRAAASRATESLENAVAGFAPLGGGLAPRCRSLRSTIQLREPGAFPVGIAGAIDARDDLGGKLKPLVLGQHERLLQELAGGAGHPHQSSAPRDPPPGARRSAPLKAPVPQSRRFSDTSPPAIWFQ